MTNRELFHATMRRENGEALLHMEQGFIGDGDVLLKRWRAQGFPQNIIQPGFWGVGTTPDFFDYFNISKFAYCGFEQYYVPPFKVEVLAEKDGRKLVRNALGNIEELRSDGEWSLPHGKEFALTDRSDYAKLRERLLGSIEVRAPSDSLRDAGSALKNQADHIVTLWVHGPFGFLRELAGPENAMYLPYDDPELVKEILQDHLQVSMEAGARVIEACLPECCYVWEDCSGSSGPFISPSVFRELFLSWYKRWTSFLNDMHVPWVVVDSDGNPEALVGLWMEGGVDWVLPWEVNSSNILRVAEDFPDLICSGGIYKHIFEPDHPSQAGRFTTLDVRAAIDEELERVVRPMRERGGYIISLDHWIHLGTQLPDFIYYCRQLEEIYGKSNQISRFDCTEWSSQDVQYC